VSFLLDTNVLSELRKAERSHPSLYAWTEVTGWNTLHTSWIAIAEVNRGIRMIRRRDKPQAEVLQAWLTEILRRLRGRILPVDQEVAEIWAELMVPKPRAPFDMLIAATARAHGLTLVTRNVRDFTTCGIDLFDPWAKRV
jgi:predicted nucleic acid-binding protein